jgi:hypothetical protein
MSKLSSLRVKAEVLRQVGRYIYKTKHPVEGIMYARGESCTSSYLPKDFESDIWISSLCVPRLPLTSTLSFQRSKRSKKLHTGMAMVHNAENVDGPFQHRRLLSRNQRTRVHHEVCIEAARVDCVVDLPGSARFDKGGSQKSKDLKKGTVREEHDRNSCMHAQVRMSVSSTGLILCILCTAQRDVQ